LYSVVRNITAYQRAGYDYAVLFEPACFTFQVKDRHIDKSVSMNDGMISDWESFEAFPWPRLENMDFDVLERVEAYLPHGMKIIPSGPGGVEENVIELMGYENLCYQMVDNPDLVKAVFDRVGELICAYYKGLCDYPAVGAIISNDDWGFNTQPLLSPPQMEEYLYPWHRRIVSIIHGAGKPAILHSCGNLYPGIMETIIEDLGYDAKHSYEDNIKPVEEAYEEYTGRIAVLGGIDVDFIISHSEEEVYKRAIALLEQTDGRPGYALGTGNSVPDYIPDSHYLAMIKAGWDFGR
jgi:uroporphyrinogen decarboxylase